MSVTVMTAPKPLSPACDPRVAGLRILLPHKRKAIVFRDHLKGTDCITIGRSRQRDCRIRNRSVSKFHCIIERIRPADNPDGVEQFRILDCDAKNGVFISTLGRYGTLREADGVILHLGMLIQLGDVLLAPMNAERQCAVVAVRHSEYAREAHACYGSPYAANKHTGISRNLLTRFIGRLRGKRSRPDSE